MAALEASLGGEALMAAPALERLAELRAGQRPGAAGAARPATTTSTSTSSTTKDNGAHRAAPRLLRRRSGEVPWEEVGHGYELDGKEVVLTDEELDAAEPEEDADDRHRGVRRRSRTSTRSTSTIPTSSIPAGDSEGTLRAYRLLVEVMERDGPGRARAAS